MTLYDYMKNNSIDDVDAWDTETDACVTVCIDMGAESEDNLYNSYYDEVCFELIKKVEFAKEVRSGVVECKWRKLIKDNIEKFRDFSILYWHRLYEEDEDEFIYQWIKEIHYYLAGYVSNDTYLNLVALVADLD